MSKRFLLIMAACVALLVGLIVFSKKEAKAPTEVGQVTEHTYGEGKTGVTLVEYGDFECPACYSYFPIVREIKEKYKDRIVFQFRNSPIVSAHPNAMAAHRAAEAASRQGKFWEMHDMLYDRQKTWAGTNNAAKSFEEYASQLGLDMDKFRQDAASEAVVADIQADLKAGKDAGVRGTPTFILNGKLIPNPTSLEEFEKLIEEAIKEKATS